MTNSVIGSTVTVAITDLRTTVAAMTGLLIFAVVVVLLVLALEPAHRRARREYPDSHGRFDLSDRDRQRVLAERRMLGGR